MSLPTSNDDSAASPVSFADLGLPQHLCHTLVELGYEHPSAIQEQAIPAFLEGRDLLGLAQTGTGKTAAFALPLLMSIDQKAPASSLPQALVLTPTRELAIQVSEAFQTYARNIKGMRTVAIYGGQDMRGQIKSLKRGNQIVVGTPGRIMDHMRRGTLKLDSLQTLILDEADEMLRMGFMEDVEWILQHTPNERQIGLFSATMPAVIERVTGDYLNDPVHIKIQTRTKTVERIDQTFTLVPNGQKLEVLTRLLEINDFDAAMIFVRTKNATMELAQKLEARGFSSAPINGDLNQQRREQTIQQLKKGDIDVLVATDVAARGIDVPRISLVVNYDIPYDAEAYVHRIGRTGRAGRLGRAILLVTHREKRLLKMIERSTGQAIAHLPVPTYEELSNQRKSVFRSRLTQILDEQPLSAFTELVDEIAEDTGHSHGTLAAAILCMLQESKPLSYGEDDPLEKAASKAGRPRDRDERGDRGAKKKRPNRALDDENVAMEIYQLAVGREQGVGVKDVLGAVANELDIDARYIGEIRLDQDCTYIELPEGMPKEVLNEFQKVRIRGHQCQAAIVKESIDMSLRLPAQSDDAGGSDRARKPKRRPAKRPGSAGAKGANKSGPKTFKAAGKNNKAKPQSVKSKKHKRSVKPK